MVGYNVRGHMAVSIEYLLAVITGQNLDYNVIMIKVSIEGWVCTLNNFGNLSCTSLCCKSGVLRIYWYIKLSLSRISPLTN